jgi:hypothetical protein
VLTRSESGAIKVVAPAPLDAIMRTSALLAPNNRAAETSSLFAFIPSSHPE